MGVSGAAEGEGQGNELLDPHTLCRGGWHAVAGDDCQWVGQESCCRVMLLSRSALSSFQLLAGAASAAWQRAKYHRYSQGSSQIRC